MINERCKTLANFYSRIALVLFERLKTPFSTATVVIYFAVAIVGVVAVTYVAVVI